MYRVMTMIMLKDMWRYIKKEKFLIFWYLILLVNIAWNSTSIFELVADQATGGDVAVEFKKAFLLCAVFFLIFLAVLMRGIPLRICRGIYVCPVGEKERTRYLFGMLVEKVAIGMIFIGVSLKCLVGVAFWSGDIMFTVIMYVLCFFSLVNVSLTFRMGDTGERRVDENGYAIQTKTEIAVKVYWTCVLLAQWVLLFVDMVTSMSPLARGGIWGICLLMNLFFIVRYVGAFLKEILLYENVYCQRPKKDDVQYDIC